MSDTPTYASLLTRLFSGNSEERASALAVLESVSDADRTAVEPEIRSRLRDSFPWMRLIAAEAVFRIYRDVNAAVDAVAGVIRDGKPSTVADAAVLIQQFGSPAVPLLVLIVRHAPDVFATQTSDYHRWAAETAVRSGPDGLNAWLEMFGITPTTTSLLIGLANAAPAVAYDLAPVEAALRSKLAGRVPGVAFGAALWRVSWRVNRDWLTIITTEERDLTFPGMRELLLEVLTEHLGRRPDIALLVRKTLLSLGEGTEADYYLALKAVERLAALGALGWGVLIPMLNEPLHETLRSAVLALALGKPTVLPLLQHHAHAAILTAEPNSGLMSIAVMVLEKLGPVAGMAIPDLLNLAIRFPEMASTVCDAIPKLAAGFPNTPSAIIRALHRLLTAAYFGTNQLTAFHSLAGVLGELDPDSGPRLVDNTSTDSLADLLLQHAAWKDAPAETRTRHIRVLADALASPRAEVRIRAAELLRHCRKEMPAVWPDLVAVLTGADEKAAVAVLPHFRHLESVADAVTADLVTLFREPNPNYAARAVVALWRLERMTTVGLAVEAVPNDGWGWALLRAVVKSVSQTHGPQHELNELFAAPLADVAETITALVNPPESPQDNQITQLVPQPGGPATQTTVDWDGVHASVTGEGNAAALFIVALMCECGTAGFARQKIWLIKHHRELTRLGLAESKHAVEWTIAELDPPASQNHRRLAVRNFFVGRTELPPEIVSLLDHRLGWFRWAGLELADAWGLSSEQVKELTEDRIWDTSPRVRARALRLSRG
ncbi:MAG: hypothetical protein K8U57_33845 [Planctomycetes bacterium]|nr:hypothetical protein [Planctomycetota bacterium]